MNREGCPRCIKNGKDSRQDNLILFPDGSKHCFACGFHVNPTISTILKNEYIRTEDKSILPDDFSREIPGIAWQWLLQYGLPVRYWIDSIGYSEKECRLIFKVGSPTRFSIGRYIEHEAPSSSNSTYSARIRHSGSEASEHGPDSTLRPRWGRAIHGASSSETWRSSVEPRRHNPKWRTYGYPHRSIEVLERATGLYRLEISGRPTVLVEDWISAHKVRQVTDSICLFGTHVFPEVIRYLCFTKSPVVLWLDNDQTGNAEKEALRLQSFTDNPVKIIRTEKDPKLLTFDQIKEHLNA